MLAAEEDSVKQSKHYQIANIHFY